MLISKKFKTGKSELFPPPSSALQEYTVSRKRMVDEQLRKKGIVDEKVLSEMGRIPRHIFVEEGLRPRAYQDRPLHIGLNQTISQPYIVALMVQALELTGGETVLEIGTGCGYQTAILAALSKKVYSVERLSPLLMKARKHLKQLNIKNVVLRCKDGTLGWCENAPFDRIVVAAVSPVVPRPFLDQLSDGGMLILPVKRGGGEHLLRVHRVGSDFHEEVLEACRFVPLVGAYGFVEKTS